MRRVLNSSSRPNHLSYIFNNITNKINTNYNYDSGIKYECVFTPPPKSANFDYGDVNNNNRRRALLSLCFRLKTK